MNPHQDLGYCSSDEESLYRPARGTGIEAPPRFVKSLTRRNAAAGIAAGCLFFIRREHAGLAGKAISARCDVRWSRNELLLVFRAGDARAAVPVRRSRS